MEQTDQGWLRVSVHCVSTEHKGEMSEPRFEVDVGGYISQDFFRCVVNLEKGFPGKSMET